MDLDKPVLKKEEIQVLNKLRSKVRRLIIEMLFEAGSVHVGGCLSIVEILVVLYHKLMSLKEKNQNGMIEIDRYYWHILLFIKKIVIRHL